MGRLFPCSYVPAGTTTTHFRVRMMGSMTVQHSSTEVQGTYLHRERNSPLPLSTLYVSLRGGRDGGSEQYI